MKKSLILCALLLLSEATFAQGVPRAGGAAGGGAIDVNIKNDGGIKDAITQLNATETNAWTNEFNLKLDWFGMSPPGLNAAILAATSSKTLEEDDTIKHALLLYAYQNLMNNLGLYTGKDSVSFPNDTQLPRPKKPVGGDELIEQMQPFFSKSSEDNGAIRSLITADVLQSNQIGEKDAVSTAQATNWMTLLIKPVTQTSGWEALRQKMSTGNLEGETDTNDMANLITEYATLSVSAYALSDMIARRTAPTAKGNEKTLSMMKIIEDYATVRFSDPEWYEQLNTKSDTAILREIAHMMAYQTFMSYQQYRLVEQQTALIASMNSMVSQLNSQMRQLQQQVASAKANVPLNMQEDNSALPSGGVTLPSRPNDDTRTGTGNENGPSGPNNRNRCQSYDKATNPIPGCEACDSPNPPAGMGCP